MCTRVHVPEQAEGSAGRDSVWVREGACSQTEVSASSVVIRGCIIRRQGVLGGGCRWICLSGLWLRDWALDPHFPPGSPQIMWFLACLQMNSHIAPPVAQVTQQVQLGSGWSLASGVLPYFSPLVLAL